MLGRRQKLKYEIVDNVGDEEIEIDTIKKKIITKPCVWSSICTLILITIYFIPSIGLTFYQRWLYTVCMVFFYKYLLIIQNIMRFSEIQISFINSFDPYVYKVFPCCNDKVRNFHKKS